MRHASNSKQFTPGPWTTDLPKSATIREKATRKVIATLGFNVDVGSTEDDDNAHLIAAAPDLLAALLECEAFARAKRTDSQSAVEWNEAERVARLAREALAKALPQ